VANAMNVSLGRSVVLFDLEQMLTDDHMPAKNKIIYHCARQLETHNVSFSWLCVAGA
jgi:hypothetical protein